MGSPPIVGLKNDVLKLRSIRSIVIAAAKTGKDSKRRTAVIKTAHTNKGALITSIYLGFIFKAVVIKLIAPMIEEIPAKCKEKITSSIV